MIKKEWNIEVRKCSINFVYSRLMNFDKRILVRLGGNVE